MADSAPVLLGAGGHARVVADLIGEVQGHVAPTPGRHPILGPWLGTDDVVPDLVRGGSWFAPALGFVDRDGAARRRTVVSTVPTDRLATLVHAAASVSTHATIASGAESVRCPE